MSNYLENKTAVITGASRGLGLQIAKSMWANGANLILVARSGDTLFELSKLLRLTQRNLQDLELIQTDLSKPEEVNQLIITLLQKKIDILVNNAAIQGPIGPLWENDWDEWQAALQVNLLAPVALARSVIPMMIQRQEGKIINLSGGGATGSRPNFSAYAVAKAGLVRFTETLAAEVSNGNISVNSIAPGIMNTALLAEVVAAGAEQAGEKEYRIANSMQDTDLSVIERAAELCVFLASSESDGITGKLISAAWDPWQTLPDYIDQLKNSDIYTLRRIVPKDRGHQWGDVS